MSTEPSPPQQPPDARRLLDLARSEYRRGSLERAWQACREVADLGRATRNADLLADAATVITGSAVGAWSLTAERHALAREALAMIGADDPERAALLNAVLVATRDPWNAAESLPNKKISVAEAQQRSARLHAELAAAVGPAALLTRLELAGELAQVAEATGRDEDAAWASLYRLEARYQLGQRLEINAEFMRLAATVRRLRAPVWDWRHAAARAVLALLDGDAQAARRLSGQALAAGARGGVEEAPYVDLVLRSSLARQTGIGLAEIEPQVRQAVVDAPFFAQGWYAGILLAMGRTAEALAIWRALAPRLADLPPDVPEWLIATAGHAELCAAAGDVEAAEFLIEQLQPHAALHLGGGLTPYEGPVSYYLALLERTVGRHSSARERLQDAIARTERLHAPLFTAAASTARSGLADLAGPLTLRELDIARLVATGLTNRQIASRLVLSERTVENHVGSILRKLGLARRSGIAAVLSAGDGPRPG